MTVLRSQLSDPVRSGKELCATKALQSQSTLGSVDHVPTSGSFWMQPELNATREHEFPKVERGGGILRDVSNPVLPL
jgi:hypothetical protein